MHAITETAPALSLTGWQWIIRGAEERSVVALMQQHGVAEVVARIMAARSISVENAGTYLNPSLKTCVPDPSHLLDMDRAAERIAAAVMTGEKIAIFGDYDVDGATSSALLARYFRALGSNPLIYIPDRMREGYGPNTAALLWLKEQGASVIITVDCGTLAFEPLEAAFEAGLDVVVIDHHIGEARKPKAYAIVNPNRLDEISPHRQMAAVGVAFLLTVAVNRALRISGWFSDRAEPDLRQWLDIVALGTICDVVPLTGVNRALVAQGLKVMAARNNTGMCAAFDLAKVDSRPGVYHAGFVLGPRINAGGRVGKSDLGVKLLITDDEAEALALARELEQHNAERKAIESLVQEEAMAQAERMPQDSPLLVISDKGWHPGVIGIVAGRIKEHFHKPVAVIGINEGVGKASARSVPGFDFGAAVISARDHGLVVSGGGHAMAAGFTVEEHKIHALAEFLGQRMLAQTKGQARHKSLLIDSVVGISGITPELVESLEQLGPFGQGNPGIRIMVQNVINLAPQWAGNSEEHIRTFLGDPLSKNRVSAIAFRCGAAPLGKALFSTRGKRINVVGHLRLQEWQGRRSVSLQIEDVAAAE